MINFENGPVHLSYQKGSGATSICLTLCRNMLKENKHVIWICRDIPDVGRSNQILGSLEKDELVKFKIIQIDTTLGKKIKIIKYILKNIKEDFLLVIDDWCSKTGKAKSNDIEGIEEIILMNKKNKIIITSTYYDNFSGGGNKINSRGGKRINKIVNTFFLYKDSLSGGRVLEDWNGVKTHLVIDRYGFD